MEAEQLDLAKLTLVSMDNDLPHLLLIPSHSAPFVKVLNNTICLNSGPVIKHNKLNTYALVTIY